MAKPFKNTSSRSSGRRGVFVQSWRETTPRSLLDRIAKGFIPIGKEGSDAATAVELARDAILKEFREELFNREDLLDGVILWWFTNNFESLLRLLRGADPKTPEASKKAVAAITNGLDKAMDKRATEKARIMLLDLKMPNGKRLRACTGAECLSLSKTYGRWLAAIAREVPEKKKVGEAVSEDRLHELYEAAG